MKPVPFKTWLAEEDSYALVKTGHDSKSLDNSTNRDAINAALEKATAHGFITPYIALGSVSRVVAYAGIVLPQYTFLDKRSGVVVFDAPQYGVIDGLNPDGTVAYKAPDYYVLFQYEVNDAGFYDCFAAVVNSEELSQLVDEWENEEDEEEAGEDALEPLEHHGERENVEVVTSEESVNEATSKKWQEVFPTGKKVTLKDRGNKYHGKVGTIYAAKHHDDNSDYHVYKIRWPNGEKSHHYHHELSGTKRPSQLKEEPIAEKKNPMDPFDGDIKKEEKIDEVSPPGFSGTVRAMKDKEGMPAKKAFALAWWMKKRGYKSHYKPD